MNPPPFPDLATLARGVVYPVLGFQASDSRCGDFRIVVTDRDYHKFPEVSEAVHFDFSAFALGPCMRESVDP